jgi:hypothetical protein
MKDATVLSGFSSAGEYLQQLGFREVHNDDGGVIVYLDDKQLMMTENKSIVEAYYTGVLQGITLFEKLLNLPDEPSETKETKSKGFSINLDHDQKEILRQFGDDILEVHSFAAYGFCLRHVEGDTPEEQMQRVITEIFTLLKQTKSKKQISFSIYFVPQTFSDWCSISGPAICLYLGCNDDGFPKSNIERLNDKIRKMPSYINAESYEPSDDAIFLGYYQPDNKTLYLENSLQMSWNIAGEVDPSTARS